MDTVVLLGQFLDYSGYAWAGRAYAKMFKSRFKNVHFVDNSIENRVDKQDLSALKLHKERLNIPEIEFSSSEDIAALSGNVFYFECYLPTINTFYSDKKIMYAPKILESNKNVNLKKISMVAWETNRFPETFVFPLKEFGYDALLLHTKEYREQIQDQVGLRTYTNHYPVLELFEPPELEKTKQRTEMFRILSFNAYSKRKGWETLLNSYYSAFYDNEDVCLRIKTHGNTENILKHIQTLKNKNVHVSVRKDQNNKFCFEPCYPKCRVELDTKYLSERQVSEYFKNFDLFATATKGEGFGLTIAQAGLSGLPIVCPDKGGHNDFCDDNCFKVKTFTTSCTGLINDFYDNKHMNLHECDHQSLKHNFRKAYSEWQQGKLHKRGVENYSKMFEYLSTPRSYNNILQIMEDLK